MADERLQVFMDSESTSRYFLLLSVVVAYFACFGSLFVTSWVREFAEKRGFVDRPDGHRKSQKTPVALGGGVAVLISSIVAILLVAFLYAEQY